MEITRSSKEVMLGRGQSLVGKYNLTDTSEALEDLTGGVTTELFTTDILDKEKFWKEELMEVNKQFLFGCATGLFGGYGMRKGIVEGHAYSIMKAVEMDGERLLLVKYIHSCF
jgi:hypothetical protein